MHLIYSVVASLSWNCGSDNSSPWISIAHITDALYVLAAKLTLIFCCCHWMCLVFSLYAKETTSSFCTLFRLSIYCYLILEVGHFVLTNSFLVSKYVLHQVDHMTHIKDHVTFRLQLFAQGLESSIWRENNWMLRMMLNPAVFIEKM